MPEGNKKDGKKNKSDDDKSRDSRSGKSIKSDIGNLRRKINNKFTTLEENIDELGDEDSNLISYDIEDNSENSHFQFHNKPTSFTGPNKFNTDPEYSVKIPGVTTPTVLVLQQEFEDRNRKVLFKNIHSDSIKLDFRNVILLGKQSTMDLLCNPNLVENIDKANKKICLQSNGGKIIITHRAKVVGYKPHVWFDQKNYQPPH